MVSPGDPITSTQIAQLAKAFNDRLRSGLGDPTWRIHFMMMSLFRGIRGKADEFTFPSELEYFWYYQNVDPINGWPAAPAGFPEGINVTNPLGAFVFGNASANLFSEGTHVNGIPTGTAGMSPLNGWDIAKSQRGAVDPSVGSYAAPMYALARRANIGIVQPSKVGLSYGSWMKLPGDFLPALFKPESKVLKRMLNTFAREFRGSDGQRGPDEYHLQEAFDCQRFFEEQYRLAPNWGTESEPGIVDAVYPLFKSAGASASGAAFKDQNDGIDRTWHPNFALDGWRASVTGATEPVSFMVEVGGQDFVEVNLAPDGSGSAADVVLLPIALLSTADVPLVISCRLTRPLPTGEVEVEFTEIEAHQPEVADLYAVLRCAAADLNNLPDGVGNLETESRVISEEYFRAGCVVNPRASAGMPDEDTVINSNAVYDAVRRFSQCVAQSRRNEFIDYAVEGGKSILWFRREFGIGEGVKVRPLDGILDIKHAADARGMTNEWVLDVELRPYGEGIGSLFKPDAYTDIYGVINRCHFDARELVREAALNFHITYGAGLAYVPESPPGWNYTVVQGVPGAHNVNTLFCGDPPDPNCIEFRRNFYRSCRLYEPPVELEKVEIEGVAPDEILKVTLTGRLHHCAEAPPSIPRSRGSWNISALRAEPYRSAENGLREYLVQFLDGGQQCTKPPGNTLPPAGNSAMDTQIWTSDSSIFGACYPLFRWTKLVPFAYDDGNNTQDLVDTHFRHDPFTQMEFYLRAMCEGFVDGRTSLADACEFESASLYDYRFEDLCMEAFGNSRIAVLPDYVDGFGPLPNTDALAAVFNQFSSAINLLTSVRVMLPTIMECNGATSEVLKAEGLRGGDGGVVTCSDFTNGWGPVTPGGPGNPTFSDEAWFECDGSLGASYTVEATGNCVGDGAWEVAERTLVSKFRFALTDGDSIEAIPESWRDMWQGNQQVLARRTTTVSTTSHHTTSDPDLASKCVIPGEPEFAPAFPTGTGTYLAFDQVTIQSTSTCGFEDGNTTLSPSDTGPTEVYLMKDNTGAVCGGGGASFSIAIQVFSGQVPSINIPLVEP